VLRSHVFELPNTELNKFIEDLIQNNPFVDESNVVVYDEFDWAVDFSDEDLYSFLRTQVEVTPVEEEIKNVAYKIIDNLDTSGFLAKPKSELIKEIKVSKSTFEKALKLVQSLDPPGVGASNLAECLILQLQNGDGITSKEKQIIQENLEDLVKENYKPIIKKYKVSIDFLKALREKLLSLDACPAAQFKSPRFISHFPDIIIEESPDGFVAKINKSSRKIIRIVEHYADLIEKIENKVSKETLEKILNEARSSIAAIEERDKLLEKIGQKIADLNRDFFKGNSNVQKFFLDEFASSDFDYTNLSRLIQNKYILTPRGLFPLRYFFKHKNEKYDEEFIMEKIKEIVDNEDKTNPLSDEEIEERIKDLGIDIKRRTIAKYRAKLNIPNSNKRKIS